MKAYTGQFTFPRGRWIVACSSLPGGRVAVHPRNGWAPGAGEVIVARSRTPRGWLLSLGAGHPAPHFQCAAPSERQLQAARANGWTWEQVYA